MPYTQDRPLINKVFLFASMKGLLTTLMVGDLSNTALIAFSYMEKKQCQYIKADATTRKFTMCVSQKMKW